MYILKTIVDTYNGVVDLDENRRLEKGFRVRILLKGVEPRKNFVSDLRRSFYLTGKSKKYFVGEQNGYCILY